MSEKIVGNGKNRQAISAASAALGKSWAGFQDAQAAGSGVEEAFSEVKERTYEAYDLASERNHRNQVRAHNEARIMSSQEAFDFYENLLGEIVAVHPKMSAYPSIARDLDPAGGVVFDMVRHCRDIMKAANKTQTAKGQRASA